MSVERERNLTAAEREAVHAAAEADISLFSYEKPAPNGRPKQNTWLVRRPHMFFVVQCVREGGENNLHYHTNQETTWLVLKGRAKFLGPGDKVWGEVSAMQGIVIPGGARYRFAKTSDEDLEILQFVRVFSPDTADSERINIEPHREWMEGSEHLKKYLQQEV